MELFYRFIQLINSFGYKSNEDKELFSILFNDHSEFMQIINYNTLSKLKIDFKGCINLYISSGNDEIDIFDFLDDENEFQNEFDEFSGKVIQYNLLLNKDKFIKSKMDDPSKYNVIFFIEKCTLINHLTQGINELDKYFVKQELQNIMVIGDSNIYVKNNYYMITNLQRFIEINSSFEYEHGTLVDLSKVIEKRNLLCNWLNGTQYLTPDHLYIDFSNNDFIIDEKIVQYIFKITIDSIIPFISNFTGSISSKYLSVINGNKRIEIYYDLKLEDYNINAYKHLYELYKWIYEESTFDKINISRNVISILVTAKCQGSEYKTIIQNSDWLAKSVQDNFMDFLQNNINSFFNEQNTVVKKLTDNITGINNQVSELTKLTITNITSFLWTAIAAIIGYIAKGDIVYIRILSFIYLCFLSINSVFNLPISIVRAMQYKNDFKHNKELYLKLYPDDSNIKKMNKRNIFNLVIFGIYTFFTISLIVVIIIVVINTDINILIEKFK